ncbi:hypothetical protein [Breoghania sp. L-A4]|uniref:hypothetical protein n=1 Tax=Breoghania sp. L-A4 TaxID=2304600 RepID=UPI0013C36DBF|nr:hypothetical protein [Breoghania sp. L-A4]
MVAGLVAATGRLVLEDVLIAYLLLAYLIAVSLAALMWRRKVTPISPRERTDGLRVS